MSLCASVDAANLPIGCFQGKIKTITKHTYLNSGPTVVTFKIARISKLKFGVVEKDPDLDYTANADPATSNPQTKYIVTKSRYSKYFIGRQDEVRPSFSLSATPRVAVAASSAKKIEYRRTIRWVVGDGILDSTEVAQGSLLKVDDAVCQSALTLQ